jgi:hypothetical protein
MNTPKYIFALDFSEFPFFEVTPYFFLNKRPALVLILKQTFEIFMFKNYSLMYTS